MKIHLFLLLAFLIIFTSCSKTIDNTGTCNDGIKNQGEQGVDCGGPCQDVCPSCADGIMNQNETAVDCGGQCDPCYPRLSAKLNSTTWQASSRNASLWSPTTLRIYGTDQSTNLTLFYSGIFEPGSFTAGNSFRAEMVDENGTLYLSQNTGTIQFTTFDIVNKVVSGTFNITVTDTLSNQQIVIDQGIFNVLAY